MDDKVPIPNRERCANCHRLKWSTEFTFRKYFCQVRGVIEAPDKSWCSRHECRRSDWTHDTCFGDYAAFMSTDLPSVDLMELTMIPDVDPAELEKSAELRLGEMRRFIARMDTLGQRLRYGEDIPGAKLALHLFRNGQLSRPEMLARYAKDKFLGEEGG